MKTFNEWLRAKKVLTPKEKEELHRKIQAGEYLDRPWTPESLFDIDKLLGKRPRKLPQGSQPDMDRITSKIRSLRAQAREL